MIHHPGCTADLVTVACQHGRHCRPKGPAAKDHDLLPHWFACVSVSVCVSVCAVCVQPSATSSDEIDRDAMIISTSSSLQGGEVQADVPECVLRAHIVALLGALCWDKFAHHLCDAVGMGNVSIRKTNGDILCVPTSQKWAEFRLIGAGRWLQGGHSRASR